MNQEPIFIVGVQRSGTTLLAAMMSAHSRLSCGPETHFFRRLAESDWQSLCRPEGWPTRAVEFLCSIRHSGFEGCAGRLLLEKYELERDQISDFLRSREPSIPCILAAVTEPFMSRSGKERWIEKTPDHIEYLGAIRSHFPGSPIIRIVRDPRDVALSLMQVPWGTRSVLEGLLFWRDRDDASERFFETDPLSCSLRFEDLVADPETTLRRLCPFIGEEYEAGMLDTSKAGRLVNSRNAPWKAKASQSLDPRRVAAWRGALSPEDNRLAEAILGDRLDRHGYPRMEGFSTFGEIYPDARTAVAFAGGLTPVAGSGIRFWKATPGERATARVFVGEPEQNHWLRPGRLARLGATARLSARILSSRILRRPLFWVPGLESVAWSGYCSAWLQLLLSPYRVRPDGPRPVSGGAALTTSAAETSQ